MHLSILSGTGLSTGCTKRCRKQTAACLLSLVILKIPVLQAEAELRLNEALSMDLFGKVIAAGFYEDNAWFGASQRNIGVDADHWSELAGELGINVNWHSDDGFLFGSASGLYAKTWDHDPSGLTVNEGNDPDDLQAEQAFIGWRSSGATFEVTGGRQDYTIGSGFLITDGASDGGNRGAFWIGMRRSFDDSVIARFNHNAMLLEAFSLKTRPRKKGFKYEISGLNIEYVSAYAGTFAVAYLHVTDAATQVSRLDGLEVFNTRYDLHAGDEGGIFINAEYAHQVNDNHNDIESDGASFQVGYAFSHDNWSSRLSYRYACLEGDDPDTQKDEGFRDLAHGVTDWGTWYQGEITGNFVSGNSNLNSHMVRLELLPREDITVNLLLYSFAINQERALNLRDDDFAEEINLVLDWQLIDNLFVSVVAGILIPSEGAEQLTGSDDNWSHLMLKASYSL